MLEGQHYQNAYVTRDIGKAVARVTARADVRSVVQFEATTEVLTAVGTRPHNIKLAFIWVEYTWMTDASWERLGGRREVTP
jgi:hypothetical protein